MSDFNCELIPSFGGAGMSQKLYSEVIKKWHQNILFEYINKYQEMKRSYKKFKRSASKEARCLKKEQNIEELKDFYAELMKDFIEEVLPIQNKGLTSIPNN